jgi:hypothetical protein
VILFNIGLGVIWKAVGGITVLICVCSALGRRADVLFLLWRSLAFLMEQLVSWAWQNNL